MINEILAFKEVKRLVRYGISKIEAKRIVGEVLSIIDNSNENTVRYAINYAVSLTYRIDFSKIV